MNNWSDTALNEEWCYGSGTWTNPYIIENCTIDATGSPTCCGICINNSRSIYFIIRNCTVVKASGLFYYGGIKLQNTNNGTLFNNNVSENDANGIVLINCQNNTIFKNTADLNSEMGINLQNSLNNTLLKNNATRNIVFGIQLSDNSANNTLVNNSASNNVQDGITLLSDSDNNTIINNTVSGNGDTGILFANYCDKNIVVNNTICENHFNGIYLNFQNNANTFANNTIINNGYGIHIYRENCLNIVRNNTVSNSGTIVPLTGIILRNGCDSNEISLNSIEDFRVGVLVIDQSDNNTVFNNKINNAFNGAFDTKCSHNFIYQNDISGVLMDNPIYIDDALTGLGARNWTWAQSQEWCSGTGTSEDPYLIQNLEIEGFGFDLYSCVEIKNSESYFVIQGCMLNDSDSEPGILLQNVENGRIFNNTIKNHQFSIKLSTNSNENIIEGNKIKDNNEDGIILQSSCKRNTIRENQIYDNQISGIYLFDNCDNNTIFNNQIYDNSEYGIRLQSNCQSNIINSNEIFRNPKDLFGTDVESGIICFDNSNFNNVSTNLIYNNYIGLYFDNSHANWIYNNCISYNYLQNAFDASTNDWDNMVIGNYWDNYTGLDLDGDGIGDTPHNIPGSTNRDDKPLVVYNPRYFSVAHDISFEIGTTGHILSWYVWDISPAIISYEIFRNSVSIKAETGLYEIEKNITINIDVNIEGFHAYRLEVNHGVGEKSIKSAWVTVINTPPSFTRTPNRLSIKEDSTGNVLTWSFSDISVNSPTYTITRNGVLIVAETNCSKGQNINLNIDGLDVGTHLFIIEIDDGYGKIITNIVEIKVEAAEDESNKESDKIEEGFTSSDYAIIIGGSIIAGAIIAIGLFLGLTLLKRQNEIKSLLSQQNLELKRLTESTPKSKEKQQ